MSEWQPIETAPKDGTVLDLWCRRNWNPPETHQRVCDFHWDQYAKAWRGPELHYYNLLHPAEERGLTPEMWTIMPEPPQ